jgi:cell division protein YceG involved in septum cleavage
MTFEGLLLPETYLVPAGVTARGLVRIMAQQGLEAWDPGGRRGSTASA